MRTGEFGLGSSGPFQFVPVSSPDTAAREREEAQWRAAVRGHSNDRSVGEAEGSDEAADASLAVKLLMSFVNEAEPDTPDIGRPRPRRLLPAEELPSFDTESNFHVRDVRQKALDAAQALLNDADSTDVNRSQPSLERKHTWPALPDDEVFSEAIEEPRVQEVLSSSSRVVQKLRREILRVAVNPQEAFKVFDDNGSGRISLTEFIGGLTSLEIDLPSIVGTVKPRDLFRVLDHDHSGSLDLYEFLGVKQQAEKRDGAESLGTAELWNQNERRSKRSKPTLARRAKWKEEEAAHMKRIEEETERREFRNQIARDWKANRPLVDIRDSRELLADPRLHRRVPKEAIVKPREDELLRQQGELDNTCRNIRQNIRCLADARHQLVQLQHAVRPCEKATDSLKGVLSMKLHAHDHADLT
jgi:hypothetical protein